MNTGPPPPIIIGPPPALGNIPPTNRTVTARGAQLQRIENGAIAEEHVHFDQLGILMQLGLVPEPATA